MQRSYLVAFFIMTTLAGEIALLHGAPSNASNDGIDKPALSAEVGLSTNGEAASVTNNVLTLPEVLSLALLRNPELAAFSLEQRAADARRIQAGLLPNPELDVAMENLGGPSYQEGFDGPVVKFTVGQLIELGGKRAARRDVADAERALAGWDYAGKRLDILNTTMNRFMEALAAQKKKALAESVLIMATEIQKAVAARVAAGRDSPLEEKKSSVETVNARLAVERARREWDKSRKNLTAMWGQSQPVFGGIEGNLDYLVARLPDWEQVYSLMAGNPDIARWNDELTLRRAALQQAKSVRMPDVTIMAGVDRFRDTGTESYRAGASVPLPLFNRNQGGIREAFANSEKAEKERAAVLLRLEGELFAAFQEITVLHKEVIALTTEVLPVARDVFESARTGYQQGKFSYLEVLDAQRTLFDAEKRNIETLVNYHLVRSQIERLIGKDMENIR
ncbi:MAG: TolC family protein [Kiritimatiellia bacterium]|nr:TolC family protein [Kiritimatiellia bacterium]